MILLCDITHSALMKVYNYTAKKFHLCIPEKELRGLSPNFHMHVSASDFYTPTIGLPVLLQENMWTDPGNICINRSQTHECGKWD
jgi:hypothetical protein